MKLHELHSLPLSLTEQLVPIFIDREQIDEGVWDALKNGFNQVAKTFAAVGQSNNTKSSLNDDTLRKIYIQERDKFAEGISTLPDAAQTAIKKLVAKGGITFSGVDLSRKNLNRILVIKLMRVVVYGMNQMKDNGVEWILTSVVSAGLGTIISLIMNAKDYAELAKEFGSNTQQIKTLFNKVNA